MAMGGSFYIILYILYILARYIFTKIQTVIWFVTGVHDSELLSKTPEGYRNSVHVHDVHIRYAPSDAGAGLKDNFLTTHNSFASPEILLADSISLYNITPTEAIFVRTDPSVNVFDSSISGFFRITQYKHATQVLTMPIQAFNKFAEKISDPKVKVLIVSNSGRCGSTLLGQIFEATGEAIFFSEPMAFVAPCFQSDQFPGAELSRVMCNIVRVLCKPRMQRYSCCVIKPMSVTTAVVPHIMKHMPQIKHIYMYRDTWSTVKSFYRATLGSTIRFLLKYGPFNEDFMEDLAKKLLGPERLQKLHKLNKSALGFSSCYLGSCLFQYLHFHEKKLPIKAFRYDDFIADTQGSLEALFQYIEMPLDLIPDGMKAMSMDSQKGTFLSRDNTKYGGHIGEYDGENKELVDNILNIFRVPTHNKLLLLPGTINSFINQ